MSGPTRGAGTADLTTGPPGAVATEAPVPTTTAGQARPPGGAMTPLPYRVLSRRADTYDTYTLRLAAEGEAVPGLRPGQFTMLYAFGVGEVPISVSHLTPVPGEPVIDQTIRAVGAVTRALCAAQPGDVVGVRGPYGTDWGAEDATGRDVVFAAGGIGLAPLRPAIHQVLADRDAYGRVVILVGARTPTDLLYQTEFAEWRAQGAQVEVTVDHASLGWPANVGLITDLVPLAEVEPARTAAFICGPEPMMRFTAGRLIDLGAPPEGIRISLERNMRCGVGWCGHCQLGPLLLCRDGAVVPYEVAAPLMAVREL